MKLERSRYHLYCVPFRKVESTKDEKRQIGRPSSPRRELDIATYSGRDNHLKIVECKTAVK